MSPKPPAYLFEKLDEIIEVTLNPEKSRVELIRPEQLIYLQELAEQEAEQIWKEFKSTTFMMCSPEQMKFAISLYESAISSLEKQATVNTAAYPEDGQLSRQGSALIACLAALKHRLNERFQLSGPDELVMKESLRPVTVPKLTCTLTVDQLGIILKAADDNRLIVSPSLSMIFKAIVPYLSTGTKKELSWDSMRSNSYHPEKRDKEAAIAALEKLINKIKDD